MAASATIRGFVIICRRTDCTIIHNQCL